MTEIKSLAEKVFDKINERNPDLLFEIITEIEEEEKQKSENKNNEIL